MIREDIAAIKCLSYANSLCLNAKKTKAMLLGSNNSLRFQQPPYAPQNRAPSEWCPHWTHEWCNQPGCPSLSLTFSWEHVKLIFSTINGVFWKLKFYKNSLSSSLRIRLVFFLISLFDYCAAVFTDLTGQMKFKLKHLMNTYVPSLVCAAMNMFRTFTVRWGGWLRMTEESI